MYIAGPHTPNAEKQNTDGSSPTKTKQMLILCLRCRQLSLSSAEILASAPNGYQVAN